MKKEYRLTKDGVNELEAELESLNELKPKVVEQLKIARSQGDLSENADYDVTLNELERVEGRIKEIQNILRNVEIIQKPRTNGFIKLGSTVKLKSGKMEATFRVVGSVEANPAGGTVSDESPIGKALMGKRVGEDVKISLPGGTSVYKIQSIS